jgi:hypothetical protein
MSARKPHWPAIRWHSESNKYYLTQYLYSEDQFFGLKWPFVCLAKEYPPIMLLEAVEKPKEGTDANKTT